MTFAVVFPGQGSQSEGMADAWHTHPAGRSVLSEASEVMQRDVVAGCHDRAALETTEFVQPALLACDVAAFRVLEAEGLTAPSIVGVAGHSLGEFAAFVASGAMRLPDALGLVVVRGEAMQRAGEERPGTMTALLGMDTEQASALCEEARGDDVLLVANENSPAQVVISGSVPAIERAETLAAERKVRAVRLNVAGAFHSELMEPAVEPILDALAEIEIDAPRFPIAENVSGTLVRRSRGAARAARDGTWCRRSAGRPAPSLWPTPAPRRSWRPARARCSRRWRNGSCRAPARWPSAPPRRPPPRYPRRRDPLRHHRRRGLLAPAAPRAQQLVREHGRDQRRSGSAIAPASRRATSPTKAREASDLAVEAAAGRDGRCRCVAAATGHDHRRHDHGRHGVPGDGRLGAAEAGPEPARRGTSTRRAPGSPTVCRRPPRSSARAWPTRSC